MADPIKVNVAVAVLVRQDDKYLLIQENQARIRGLWHMPGGKVDEGETLEMAAVREAKEETGYDVELIKQVALIHAKAGESVKHVFEAKIIGGKVSLPAGEIMDLKWFSFAEVSSMQSKLRKQWVFEVISDFEKRS